MSDLAVKIENICKKYILNHEKPQKYTALRDILTNKVKFIGNKIVSPFSTRVLSPAYNSKEEFWALNDISFEIKKGERIGIIGRNGAGKSTLLKVLSRITEPTSGRISTKGRVASLLEVGTGFHPELTGRENIFLNGAILGMRKAEIKSKFDEIVAFAEVEKFLDTPVKFYSSGMYVRLAFAVASHLEPEILVVDEVLAVGDFAFQKKCLGKMNDVAKGGRTVLFVSHNMAAIRSLCESAIWIDSGKIIKEGSANEVIKSYVKDQTQLFNEMSCFTERDVKEIKNKSFFFVSVEMLDIRNDRSNIYNYDDSFNLIVSLGGYPKESFSVEFYIYNESGQLISCGSSGAYHGIYFNKDTEKVKIQIGPLTLTSDKYSISLSLVKGVDGVGITRSDTWENSCVFTIAECKPFRTNWEIPASREGVCVIQQTFGLVE